jgi:hypothetical protein
MKCPYNLKIKHCKYAEVCSKGSHEWNECPEAKKKEAQL